MFKLERKSQSIDTNNNMDKNIYKYNQGLKNFLSYKDSTNKTLNQLSFNDKMTNEKDNSFNRFNKLPPVYFFRKINNPYKYNMTAVPQYLIKSNEEKKFVQSLCKSIVDDTEKKMLKKLIFQKKLNSRKDVYKPKCMDIHNILEYNPKFYQNTFSPSHKIVFTSTQNDIPNNNTKDEQSNKVETEIEKKDENENDTDINLNENLETEINKPKNRNKGNEISKEEFEKKKNEILIRNKYKLSDVFNLSNEPLFLNKSSEKYFFKERRQNLNKTVPKNLKELKDNENIFHISSESKSDWIPNKSHYKKMGTNSSVAYNILSPLYTGFNKFISSREINKNNLYNESPFFHKVKSISEFIDLTRVSATNTLGCFNINIHKNLPNFKFKNSVATNQLDEFNHMRDLVEKPV